MTENWTEDEENAVAEFRRIMKNDVPRHMFEDKYVFYKFLKARNFNLHQAEAMLRKHLIWRKEVQIDSIITDFKLSEAIQKYTSQSFIGFDKQGCLIQYSALGNVDGRGLFKSANGSEVLKCVLQEIEKILRRLKYQSEKLGKPVNQSIFIYNMENMTLAKATHRRSIDLFAQGISMFQDNYPEFLKKIYIINGSLPFTIAFSIVKRVLSGALLDKIIVHGKEGWRDVLLSVIDADVLPAFLGGNRTDPDGNPYCKTFIGHAGMVPESYYLTKDFSKMAEKKGVKLLDIDRHSTVSIPINVQYAGSILNWEYEVKLHDIGFGLMLEKPSLDASDTELIPVHKVETEYKPETGMYRCRTEGTYHIIFDNTYSWFHSKEVCYRTWVTDPYDNDFHKENTIFEIDF